MKKEKQLTAVEWFWNEIAEVIPFTVDSTTAIKMYDKLQQAKEMEKEQIEKEISDEEIYEIFNRLSSYLINVNSPLSEKEAIIVGMKLYREQIKTLKSE